MLSVLKTIVVIDFVFVASVPTRLSLFVFNCLRSGHHYTEIVLASGRSIAGRSTIFGLRIP